MTATDHDRELESLELELLLEAIHQRYGYDFRGYARASLRRRLWRRADLEGLRSLSGLQERVLHDPRLHGAAARGPLDQRHRDVPRPGLPPRAARATCFPQLRTHPFIRVWVAGCSTGRGGRLDGDRAARGGDARPHADLRHRHGRRRARPRARGRVRARQAARLHAQLPRGRRRRRRSAPTTRSSGDRAVFDPALLRDVVFAQHNLATDRSFNEFHVVICRNVLIYFGRELQDRVLRLFDESLPRRGVLALGPQGDAARAPRSRTATSRWSRLRGSTGDGHDRCRADRHRRLLGRPARRRRDPRGPARRTSARPCSSSSTAPRTPTTCSPGCSTAAGRCPCARSRTRTPLLGRGRAGRAGGLPRARRARPLRAVHRGAGALQPAVDRRGARVRGRRARARAGRRRADRRQRRRRRRPGRGAPARRDRDRPGPGDGEAADDARRRRARPRPQVVAELAGDRAAARPTARRGCAR